ncbi:hypothetical protein RD110_06500 [Rhodoferax koreense]|uniref:DUF2917 domain-containing protein n=1 Tax=Rhodoferax koreensis TaxID=1842727 RepID=A0A1P8JT07_9BURK|nr:DUF2917 domain-containing protein [Rhodoferax koreense]APW36886.1 hypothetical protein RD110_06500 [Rhodoferax koreense]
MATPNTLELQQSLPLTARMALAGCWKLEAGRATTLQPNQAGMLRVAHGAVWVTFDGPHRGAGNELGDHVLRAGEQIELRPGQRAVVEPWFIGAIDQVSPPAYFSWDPVTPPRASGSRRDGANAEWHGSVVRPGRELAVALGLACGALGRLVMGLGHWGSALLGGRGAGPRVART